MEQQNPSGSRFKALIPKVSVETEGRAYPSMPHGLEADAINDAQLTPSGYEHSFNTSPMLLVRHPVDLEQRHYVFLKRTHGQNANPVLQQSQGF
jgi:hypothetical protein